MLPSPTPNYSGFQKWMPRSLGKRMLLLMMGLLVLLVCATGFIGNQIVTGILNEYIGRVALNVSRSVSLSPIVSQGLIQLESDGIQRYAESVREATGASFVVVGDYEGKRYSHPVPERIGKYMVGGDMRERWYKGSPMSRLPLALLGLLSVVKCPFSQLKEKSLELFLWATSSKPSRM